MASVNITPKNKLLISVKIESGARGPKGDIGLTPQLSVANTITGAPNTNAGVTIAGAAENPALTFTIPIGRPFDIAAKYSSISDLTSNTNPIPSSYDPELFDLAIIQSNVEDEDNARLYIYDENPTQGKGGWTFISDLSGATGPRRNIRWKEVNGQTTSILQWELEDGSYNETDARDLALKFEFNIDSNNDLILEIENPDGITDSINLTATAEFGTGGLNQPTVTSVKFINNNNTETSFQELGVYASFTGTELKLTNPDATEITQELALDFNWEGTTLQIKNPTEESYLSGNEQKLSPDIDFDTTNGVSISVVEPGVSPTSGDFFKISPDIAFQNEGSGLELSIVEPGAPESFNKISPDITFDGTKVAITEPDTSPSTENFVELGVFGSFGGSGISDTTLVITNPDDQEVTQELGVYANFGGSGITDTTLVLTNPDNTTVDQELGVYATFDGTELTLTNPDTTEVTQELALDFNWDGTTLQIKNPAEASYDPNNEQKLSPDIEFRNVGNGLELSIVEPETTPVYNKVSPDIIFEGTKLAIMEPGVAPTSEDFVELKGETGDASEPGTPLFKLRDEDDTAGNGLQITVDDEIQFIGSAGIEVKRVNGTYTVELVEIDGGTFLEPTPTPE